MKGNLKKVLIVACILALFMATESLAMNVTQTTNDTALITALGGAGLTINSVSITNGDPNQFGTYTGFTSPPVTLGNGVVMSNGYAVQTTAAFHSPGFTDTPNSNMGVTGTPEFNAYGPGKITNFSAAYDVAALQVNFTLSAPSKVGFDFVFGTVEYPQFVNSFTDAFIAFLDGTTNQIVFDASNNPVSVGNSFASALTTADTNTAFSDPHGLVKLQTFTGVLAAGSHSILFEVGDVNDHVLDSAVFISDFHAGEGQTGTGTGTVPEPATLILLGLGLAGLSTLRKKIKG